MDRNDLRRYGGRRVTQVSCRVTAPSIQRYVSRKPSGLITSKDIVLQSILTMPMHVATHSLPSGVRAILGCAVLHLSRPCICLAIPRRNRGSGTPCQLFLCLKAAAETGSSRGVRETSPPRVGEVSTVRADRVVINSKTIDFVQCCRIPLRRGEVHKVRPDEFFFIQTVTEDRRSGALTHGCKAIAGRSIKPAARSTQMTPCAPGNTNTDCPIPAVAVVSYGTAR